MERNKMTLINEKSTDMINELIKDGWHFTLTWCDILSKENEMKWEADFTKRMTNGLWDNHKDGESLDVNKAIEIAYNNIKTGKRLK